MEVILSILKIVLSSTIYQDNSEDSAYTVFRAIISAVKGDKVRSAKTKGE